MDQDHTRIRESATPIEDRRGMTMMEPDEVSEMRRLQGLGLGTRRIATELGCSRTTVQGWLQAEGWQPFAAATRPKLLDGHGDWLRERFLRHAGNADVVRQELAAEKGVTASLRTVERAVQGWRRELAAAKLATVRFETAPGKQMQIDFGERLVEIGGVKVKVYFFVATLGFSRRVHVRAYRNERQDSWFEGLESAFRAFGGVTEDVLIDNARTLVEHHDRETREVTFNSRFKAFAKHWRFTPKACAPYRARTKGKTESGVGYVKKNAIAGRTFESFASLEAHLDQWTREIADAREHGTTGEAPAVRFERDEKQALKSIAGVGPFETTRELRRTVSNDCSVEVDTNAYSVPWILIGLAVQVIVTATLVRVSHAGREVAVHGRCAGRLQRVRTPAHFDGVGRPHKITPANPGPLQQAATAGPVDEVGMIDARIEAMPAALLRPLSEYEAIAGGRF